MSTVKLTLRPPPNVDYVQGYPGIPPGPPDRPQAAVKGTIEVRVGPQGCKAKWVRVELKKIETLPGGGQANTFFDFVGPSPVNLWQSSEEFSMLPTQDFPFYIRIPESIPPSTVLDKGAGIRYELVASVCVKGKKGFLRRGKAVVVPTLAIIPIDKHELHSTWPVYSQPETRQLPQEGVNLTVERTRNCYGPGDRVSVMATLKSDSLHTVILRGFEFTLKETTIFRAGPHAAGKNKAPQVREGIVGEQKVPVNVTLYGGTQHKAELACIIPQNHQTTSLNSARHIDITYTLFVKALMGTGGHLVMELPIIVTNWPRSESVMAIKRIGTAPSLSLGAAGNITSPLPNNQIAHSLSLNGGPSPSYQLPTQRFERLSEFGDQSSIASVSPGKYNTLPSKGYQGGLEEFGYGRPELKPSATAPVRRPSTHAQDDASSVRSEVRPSTARRGTANGRFTITNIGEHDDELNAPEVPLPSTAQSLSSNSQSSPSVSSTAQSPTNGRSARGPWLSAEEEKKRLYDEANAKVARVQGTSALQSASLDPSPPVSHRTASPPPPIQQSTTPPKKAPWLSAEEEKVRIYEQAQANAMRTQMSVLGYGAAYSPSLDQGTFSPRPDQSAAASGSHTKPPSMGQPTGANLYQRAISSMNSNGAEQTLPSPPSSRDRVSPPIRSAVPAFASAEEEKAVLKRYHEAKSAVDRTQGIQAPKSPPLPYDSLYPQNLPRTNSYSASTSNPLAEKEKLRRAFEAHDAAAYSQQIPAYDSRPSSLSAPDYAAPEPSGSSHLSEKERLRRKYEANDAAALANASAPPQPPPRRPSVQQSLPPPPIGGSSILSAVEEKARLKAMYEAEERQKSAPNGLPPPSFDYSTMRQGAASTINVGPPPPLMPRPPAEYIQETQEEDARVRDTVAEHDIAHSKIQNVPRELGLGPFAPFRARSINGISNPPGPPPPLPPKQFTD